MLKHRRAVRAEESQHASIADSEVEQHGGDWMWVNPVGADLQELADLADSRKMRVEVAEVFPLEKPLMPSGPIWKRIPAARS